MAVRLVFRLLLVFATFFLLLFAGLPAAHEMIIGVGFFLRLTADFFTERRLRGAATFATALRLRFGGFGRVRTRCLGALRLVRNAAFWRFVPKILICFALILRRAFAMFLFPFFRAGF